MASRTVTKDIITLRGSAAIVSEFFGMLLCLIDLLDKNPVFKFSVRFSLLGFVENLGWSNLCISLQFLFQGMLQIGKTICYFFFFVIFVLLECNCWVLKTNVDWKMFSILYNRGLYPEESFVKVKKYGLPMLLTQDESVKSFIANVTAQLSGKLCLKSIEYFSVLFGY